MKLLALLVLLLAAFSSTAFAQDLETLIDGQEAILKTLAAGTLQAYQNRCDRACEQSYSCESMFDETRTECVKTFGAPNDCGTACGGRKLAKHTTWWVPTNSLGDAPIVKESECWSQQLDSIFPQAYESADPERSLKELETSKIKWAYIGLPSGGFRIFPGVSQECYTYDPRTRPWYVAATSGTKDVILVIDVSGSMYDNDRVGLTVEAINVVLDTLGNADFFNVVLFANSAKAIQGGNTLIKVNEANIESMKTDVAEIEGTRPSGVGGGTNFAAGFGKAFDLFDASTEATSSCQKTILFMTDGQVTDGLTDDALYTMINGRNQAHNAVIFSYSLGAGADDRVPKAIACANSGIWSQIPDGGNLQGYMSRYYDYFSRFRQITSDTDVQAYWTLPYEDATGAGELITGAFPVYDTPAPTVADPSPLPVLVGVVGVDLLTEDLREIEPDYEQFVEFLVRRSRFCPEIEVNTCDLEFIRQLDDKGAFVADDRLLCEANSSAVCTFIAPEACNQENFVPSAGNGGMDETKLFKSNTCCGSCLSDGALAGIIIAAIIVVVAIIIGIVVGVKRSGGSQSSGKANNRSENTPQEGGDIEVEFIEDES